MAFKRFKTAGSMTFVHDEEESTVPVRRGKTVLDTAIDNEIPLDHSCTAGTCGSCRVFIVEGADLLSEREEVEADTARLRRFTSDERLACQISACAGLKVRF